MKEFVLITGQSGAGKSQAAGILEDMGFFCVDNLPTELLDGFTELCQAAEGKYDRVALVSDIRGRRDIGALAEHIRKLKESVSLRVLFLEATDAVILNRYKETRHLHPLDPTGNDLPGAIRREKEALAPLRALADETVDTSELNWSSLKLRLGRIFLPETKDSLYLHVCSFGYKNGLPAGADLVMDVRFLPNPFYVPELKPLTGLDPAVRDYVCAFPATAEFLEKMKDMLAFLLPRYLAEGKSSLLLAVGCTGGKHRSVVMAERLTVILRELGYTADCVHRELR
jgi:UPF0042 nucleotide-binding protein